MFLFRTSGIDRRCVFFYLSIGFSSIRRLKLPSRHDADAASAQKGTIDRAVPAGRGATSARAWPAGSFGASIQSRLGRDLSYTLQAIERERSENFSAQNDNPIATAVHEDNCGYLPRTPRHRGSAQNPPRGAFEVIMKILQDESKPLGKPFA